MTTDNDSQVSKTCSVKVDLGYPSLEKVNWQSRLQNPVPLPAEKGVADRNYRCPTPMYDCRVVA